MKLLALETSSAACSVALAKDDEIVERHSEAPREHTRLLMPMIREVLAETHVEVSELDALVLGNGPGSFIGMRISASVAQGIAFGAGLGVAPVSSLAAVAGEALAADAEAATIVVAQDARMDQIYLGIYGRDAGALPAAEEAERLHGQGAIEWLTNTPRSGVVAAGIGWQRYPALLAANRQYLAGVSPVHHPRARFLLPLGQAAVSRGQLVDPQALNPAYLRDKVAEKPVPPS